MVRSVLLIVMITVAHRVAPTAGYFDFVSAGAQPSATSTAKVAQTTEPNSTCRVRDVREMSWCEFLFRKHLVCVYNVAQPAAFLGFHRGLDLRAVWSLICTCLSLSVTCKLAGIPERRMSRPRLLRSYRSLALRLAHTTFAAIRSRRRHLKCCLKE